MANGLNTWKMTLLTNKGRTLQQNITIRQGDDMSQILELSIKNDNHSETITEGAAAVLCVPMGNNESIELPCSWSNGKATVTLPAAIAANRGSIGNVYVKIVDETNSTVATTESFIINVLPGAGEIDYNINDFEPYLSLVQALDEASGVEADAERAEGAADRAEGAADRAEAAASSLTFYATDDGAGNVVIHFEESE